MIGDEVYEMICSTIYKLMKNSTIYEYDSDNKHELLCISYDLNNNEQIKEEIKEEIPKYRLIKKDDKLIKEGEKCVICLEKYKVNEYKRELKCGHVFHKKCIDKWFKKSCCDNKSCPLCRIKNN